MRINRTILGLYFVVAGSLLTLSTNAQSNTQAGGPQLWEIHPPIHIHRTATDGPTGYTPAQIRHAYGFDQFTSNGAGQKIAIVDAYGSPTIQKDLNTFNAQFDLPTTTVQIYYPQGKPARNNKPG